MIKVNPNFESFEVLKAFLPNPGYSFNFSTFFLTIERKLTKIYLIYNVLPDISLRNEVPFTYFYLSNDLFFLFYVIFVKHMCWIIDMLDVFSDFNQKIYCIISFVTSFHFFFAISLK